MTDDLLNVKIKELNYTSWGYISCLIGKIPVRWCHCIVVWETETPILTSPCLFFLNWRLIALQYCGGFCHTLTWISHGCTCVHHPEPPSPSHPLGSSQGTSPEHPVSCIEPGLAIYFTYDNIHVSMLFSQIIPPSLSPTESKSLFFTSVSLLLSCM